MYGNTHPDVAFAANICARYTFSPKRYHKLALKILEILLEIDTRSWFGIES